MSDRVTNPLPVTSPTRIWTLVLGGAVLDAALTWFFDRLPVTLFESRWPAWLLDTIFNPVGSVSSLGVGITIGLLARRYSFWIGAAAFCLGTLLFRVLDRLIFSPGVWPPLDAMWFADSLLRATVLGGVLSFGGEYLRSWWNSARATQLHSHLSRGAITAVLVAYAVYAAGAYLAARLPEHVHFSKAPGLLEWTYIWLRSFSVIAFGFSIGWLSKSDGVRVAAIVFALGSLTSAALYQTTAPYASINPLAVLHDCVVAALYGAIYALAGEYARSRRSSNERVEPTHSEKRAAQA